MIFILSLDEEERGGSVKFGGFIGNLIEKPLFFRWFWDVCLWGCLCRRTGRLLFRSFYSSLFFLFKQVGKIIILHLKNDFANY
jgi:hypothetical protein